MKRNRLVFLPVIILAVFMVVLIVWGIGHHERPQSSGGRIITDMDDSMIEIPADPRRIACMHGVSAERIVILGGGNRLTFAMQPSPWMLKIFPEVQNYEVAKAPFTGNLERMLDLNVDLVLYSAFPGEAEKYRAAGIKTACGFSAQKRPRTIDEFSENFRRQVTFFGKLLGPEHETKAQKYCRYFDDTVRRILAVTSKIKLSDRPSVYYGGRNGNPLLGQGMASVMHWDTEVAGGNFLTRSMDNNFIEVNMEQVYAWDPDIILLSAWSRSVDEVTENPNWKSLRAVKTGRVYLIPRGVFAWDFASGESPLFMIWMAKIFHPELFSGWNMADEMKKFYSEIYGKKITDADAERILAGLPPL